MMYEYPPITLPTGYTQQSMFALALSNVLTKNNIYASQMMSDIPRNLECVSYSYESLEASPFQVETCSSYVPVYHNNFDSFSAHDVSPLMFFLGQFDCSSCCFHEHSTETPLDFISNVVEKTLMHESIFVVTMSYLCKFFKSRERAPITPCGRCLFASCALLATKYLDDECMRVNATWANIVGVPVSQMNAYERELLNAFEYGINVNEVTYAIVERALCNDVLAQCLNLKRGKDDVSKDFLSAQGFYNNPIVSPDAATVPTPTQIPTEVDPNIFVTAEYQRILQDLYTMN